MAENTQNLHKIIQEQAEQIRMLKHAMGRLEQKLNVVHANTKRAKEQARRNAADIHAIHSKMRKG